jgi:hypothetical protein
MIIMGHTHFSVGLWPSSIYAIEYFIYIITSNGNIVNDFVKALNNHILKLKELIESTWGAIDINRIQQWNNALWLQNHYCPKSFKLENYV